VNDAVVGEIAYVQLGAEPLWLTVNVWPAIVIVPIRAVEVFASTEYCTTPFPFPLEPDVT